MNFQISTVLQTGSLKMERARGMLWRNKSFFI